MIKYFSKMSEKINTSRLKVKLKNKSSLDRLKENLSKVPKTKEEKNESVSELAAKILRKNPNKKFKKIIDGYSYIEHVGTKNTLRLIKKNNKTDLVIFIYNDCEKLKEISEITKTPFKIIENNKEITNTMKMKGKIEFKENNIILLGRIFDLDKIKLENFYI
jgi:molybdopterin converting factor small subunit